MRRRPSILRLAAALAALVLVLAILAGAHYYVALRLVIDPGLAGPLRAAALGAIALLGASLVLAPIAERGLSPARLRPLVWLPFLWMGVLFLVLLQLLASDGALWLMGASGADPTAAHRVRALAVVGLTALATTAGLRSALAGPVVKRVELVLERWPRGLDGFRIAQISDVHIGPLLDGPFAERVVEQVNRMAPDLVAITGDLVDGPVHHLAADVAPFGGLRAPHGVYFVTGNHDYYSGADPWVEHVASLGIRPLRNERVAIGEPCGTEAGFDLAGVDDYRGDWVRGSHEDLDAALSGRDPGRAVVLLAHDPSTFKRACEASHGGGVDLQLSGHTHGGQIWPFRHFVRLAVPFVEGLHRRNRSWLYVSRGTGFWGPPLRLFAPAEITEITLRAAP